MVKATAGVKTEHQNRAEFCTVVVMVQKLLISWVFFLIFYILKIIMHCI